MTPAASRPARRAVLLPLLAAALVAGAGCDGARPTLPDGDPCMQCHGGVSLGGLAPNWAPPRSGRGATSTSDRGVGAHQAHLNDSSLRRAVGCAECHVVPTEVMGHFGDAAATLTWGELATARGATPSWDRDAGTCSGVYCHGDTLGRGGDHTRPVWTTVDGSQKTCDACHGFPPQTHLPTATDCNACHPLTVRPDGTIDVAGGTHIDGRFQVSGGGGACDACHGAPPPLGAHLAHATPPSLQVVAYGDQSITADVDPSGATGRYYFGCGFCHPSAAEIGQRHMNGATDVDLSPLAGVAGGLKERNDPSAGYVAVTGTCSGVSCHSSGQAVPAFAEAPDWNGGVSPGCGGCHGNPPFYLNGGPGGNDANTHIGFDLSAYEYGHFAGVNGSHNQSKHGRPLAYWNRPLPPPPPGPTDERASPITCQACHYATVDPANVAPGGFFYLDTTVTTNLGPIHTTLGDPSRFTQDGWRDTQCLTCHDGQPGSPPQGSGRVLPLRHVNGARDVVFDPRTAANLPAGWFAFLDPERPAGPYFWTNYALSDVSQLAPGTVLTPPPPPPPIPADYDPTVSFDLTAARYDPATKTCTAVACHMSQASVTWGSFAIEQPPYDCGACHPNF